VETVLSGFNFCLIGYGERNSLKTTTLFGDHYHSYDDADSIGIDGVLPNRVLVDDVAPNMALKMLQKVFAAAKAAQEDGDETLTVGISAWVLRGQHVIE